MTLPLPPLLEFDEQQHSVHEFAEIAYAHFRADVVGQHFIVDGRSVLVKDDGKCLSDGTAFWHVATDEDGIRGRYPVVERCRHVTWIGPMLRASGSGVLNEWWNFRQTSRGRQYGRLLSTPNDEFCVILREAGEGRFYLLTAYPVDKTRTRARMQRERADWQNS